MRVIPFQRKIANNYARKQRYSLYCILSLFPFQQKLDIYEIEMSIK